MTNKIVGIFGGAFDPVHKGHIKIADQCIEKIGMEKIIIVPTSLTHVSYTHLTLQTILLV